jgi:FMN phosphatase YigB (HAD superfamily)
VELTILFDVDNTLLDNDRAKRAIDDALANLLGQTGAARFWELYEVVRRETGKVNIPLTVARYDEELERAPIAPAERRRLRFELADLVMTFRYDAFVFPGALAALARAQSMGRTAILSEGDQTFQPSKIWRSGLTDAARGNVLVFEQKIEHFAEVVAAFPGDHHVLVEDKPVILEEFRRQLGPERVTAVLVRQGKYGRVPLEAPLPDIVLEHIEEFAAIDADRLGPILKSGQRTV